MRKGWTFTRWIVVLSAATMVVAACGDGDTGDADEPPWGLADMELPDTAAEIEAAFGAMPDEIDGMARELDAFGESIRVTYEEPLEGMPSVEAFYVRALEDWARAEGFGDDTEVVAYDYMEMLLAMAEEDVDPGGVSGKIDETSSMDPDADLIWATGWGYQDDTTAYSVVFAHPDSDWVFTMLASTPELRINLVQAFCEAVVG